MVSGEVKLRASEGTVSNPIRRCVNPALDREKARRMLRLRGISLEGINVTELPDGSLFVTLQSGEQEWQLEIDGRSDLALVLTIAADRSR